MAVAFGQAVAALGQQIPETLTVAGQSVGRLTIVGERNGNSMYSEIRALLDQVEPFEEHLKVLLDPDGPVPVATSGAHDMQEAHAPRHLNVSRKYPK